LDVGDADAVARDVLRLVAPVPDLTLLRGRVLAMGGGRQPVYELESAAPGIWKVRLGHTRLDFPRESESLLHRLNVGRPLAGYWGQVRFRFSITPRQAGGSPFINSGRFSSAIAYAQETE